MSRFIWSVLAMICLISSIGAQDNPANDSQTTAQTRRSQLPNYRLIYNSDANNIFIYDDPPMSADDVYDYVDEAADAGVTSFFISPNWGMNMNYPTEVGDMIGERAGPELEAKITLDAPPKSTERGIANLRALIKAGHDPLGLIVNRAKERGLEIFVSFRLNEVHAVEQEDHVIFSHFWKENPQWHIGKAGDPLPQVYLNILGPNTHPIVAGWLPGGLDFSVAEVRAHRLAQLRECCEKYDIDGLDLDFQRFPMYFKPGEEENNIPLMTAWMRDVRIMVQEVGDKRGRPVLLSARIMARPEQNRAIGLDSIAWIDEKLLDFVVVSHYLRNDFQLPVKEYQELLPENYPLYASIEVAKEPKTYYEIARQLWRDGVDGILLFNFFTTRERGVEPPFEIIPSLGDPKKLETLLDEPQ